MHNAALVVLICCLLCLGDGDCRTFTFKAAKPFRPGAAFSHPCDSAFVKLRSSSTAVLNVDQDWMFKDVVLPQDVEIIFTDSVTVREIPLETMACDGNSVRYREQVINPVLQNWHDPKSWIVSGSRSFALHADLIPGSYDTAVFLKNETYYVNISAPASIGSLFISGTKQTIQSFLSHVSSKEGSLQFNVSAAFALAHDVGFDDSEDSAQRIIEITSETCGDPSGCVNPNMEEATMNKICSNVKCMTDHSCTNAVKPKGHCCPVCAALMRFATGYGFVQKDMEKEVARKVSRSLKDGIEISLVKVSENFFYQLVIVPASKHFDKSHMLNAASIIKSKVLDEALGVFLLITGMALLSLVIVWKRSALLNWIIRGRLQLRIIWRGNRGDDRIQLELNDPPDCSPTPSTSGFANPSFSQLMKYDAQKDNEEFLNEAASYYKIPFPASDKKHA